ncbi:cellulose synthase subunit BcsC-related outer membrane protein [Alteromonas sp. CYL-A6]|uniref:cellulose synthase subunit BcsC-related outer membrane protein n=1 Tax=Alteromonas nitratireducens TaxID=3390813 RepID=UPI0034B20194
MNKSGISSLALLVLGAGLSVTVSAQVATEYTGPQPAVPAEDTERPDTTGVWFHIQQGQKALANAEFKRLTTRYPLWQPAPDLRAALDALNNPVVAEPAPREQAPAKPGKDAVFGYIAVLTSAQRQQLPDTEFARASSLAFTLGDARHHELMGWVALERNQPGTALRHFDAATQISPEVSLNEAKRRAVNAQAVELARAGQWTALDTLSERYSETDVSDTINTLAWAYFDKGDYRRSQQLFEYTQHVEGQALSLQKRGFYRHAGVLACGHTGQPPLLEICQNWLQTQQLATYEQKDFRQSLIFAGQLASLGPLALPQRELQGWAAYQAGNVTLAVEALGEVLEQQHSRDDIAAALQAITAGDLPLQQELAARFPSIASQQMHGFASQAQSRKQFQLAYHLGDENVVTAQTKDALTVTGGLRGRARSGQRGLGNFDEMTGYIGVQRQHDAWRWGVALDYAQLYSGKPSADDWFAGGQVDNTFAGISGFEDKAVRAEVEFQDKGVTLYGNIEYGLFDQPVSTRLTGMLGAAWYSDKLTAAISWYRDRKTDSLLSQTGTFNDSHEESWGRVMADGVRALIAVPVAPTWSVSTTLRYENLTGERVLANSHAGIRGDVSKDIAGNSRMLDYWRVGPFISYDRYDANLSAFTYGHGGYFSPQKFLVAGLYSELLTAEYARGQAKLSVSLGYGWITQDDYNRFPLTASGERVEGSRSQGLNGQVTLDSQWRLTDNWVVAGFVSRAFAVEYREFLAGLQFMWRPGNGEGVTSDELILSSPRLSGFAL